MRSDVKDFLIELRKLTIKTGIAIGGCGCCGSPFLFKTNVDLDKCGYSICTIYDDDGENLKWIDGIDEEELDEYQHKIVKEDNND